MRYNFAEDWPEKKVSCTEIGNDLVYTEFETCFEYQKKTALELNETKAIRQIAASNRGLQGMRTSINTKKNGLLDKTYLNWTRNLKV